MTVVPGDRGRPGHQVDDRAGRGWRCAVAAVASYGHAYPLVRAHGEAGWTGRIVPLTMDGLIYPSSMVMLNAARRRPPGSRAGPLAPGPGHRGDARGQCGLGRGPVGAAVAAWSAVALVGSYELLMMVICGAQLAQDDIPDKAEARDPLQEQAAEVFVGQLAADRVPSVRAIRAQFHVGQPRAQRLRDHLAAGVTRAESLAV